MSKAEIRKEGLSYGAGGIIYGLIGLVLYLVEGLRVINNFLTSILGGDIGGIVFIILDLSFFVIGPIALILLGAVQAITGVRLKTFSK